MRTSHVTISGRHSLGVICVAVLWGVFSLGSSSAETVTAGQSGADFTGTDQTAIQAAIDHVPAEGGGEVTVLAGEYVLSNSVMLRSGVVLKGQGEVVFRKDDGLTAQFTSDCGFGYDRVKVADPGAWQVGWGVTLKDDRNAGGFNANVRTIAAIEGDDLVLDEDTSQDYCVHRNARIIHAFPLVAAYRCQDAAIVGITCDGNASENELLDGCRGGAIYFFRCERCTVRGCVARNFNGDGISFQMSPYTLVVGCASYGNTKLGLHPGSGSHHCELRDCEAHDNGSDGLFLCWRVAHSRFEGNRIHDNAGNGISIGHKDTDGRFLNNTIEGNRGHGVYFRNEPDYNAGHRCRFERNVIHNNGGPEGAAVFIDGATTGTRIVGNTITDDRGDEAAGTAIRVGEKASDVVAEGNEISGFKTPLLNESPASDVHVEP